MRKEMFLPLGAMLMMASAAQAGLLAWWRFEQVQPLQGDLAPAEAGRPLTADDRGPAGPQPYAFDDSGSGNFLQVRGAAPSPNLFSENVPSARADGKPNTRSLLLKGGEAVVPFDRPLAYCDLRESWMIEAGLMCNRPETEQVYLCKEGEAGQLTGDVSVGFDSRQKKYFAEVMCADGVPRRVAAGDTVEAGKWYDVRARAGYDVRRDRTTLQIEVKPSGRPGFGKPGSITFAGPALRRDAGMWVIGRGYSGGASNHLPVLDGAIDEVRISGAALPRVDGQNPLFTDAYTADPAATVVGDTVYLYAGRDAAGPGGWFYMPEWLCYSTRDMKHWEAHGPVLRPEEFSFAAAGTAWAAQMVPCNGKYYFYVTLRRNDSNEHCIGVAVSDSPTGPFKDARGTPLITDGMTTDSSRGNADIDPTVFIDDDGTPWMMWGNGDFYLVKLKRNMIELDGPIRKMPHESVAEGPWLFKRNGLYYNVYAADVPGNPPEKIAYATAAEITGPWTYRGLVTGSAKHGFTIHPSVIEFKGQWYFFYHDGSNSLDGTPGGDCRRSVCLEYLFFNPDGTIKPVEQTVEGVSVPPKK